MRKGRWFRWLSPATPPQPERRTLHSALSTHHSALSTQYSHTALVTRPSPLATASLFAQLTFPLRLARLCLSFAPSTLLFMTQTAARRRPGVAASNKPQPAKLLDRVSEAIRARHYSLRTEEAYVGWVRRFILFHNKRHPAEMGEPEINQFLSYLAVSRDVSASTQNQALSAILFLYQVVLQKELDRIDGVVRAKKPKRLPVVLGREEVRALLGRMSGTPRLAALLLYGAGLRLLEALRLRVKDIDFTCLQITVRGGKGEKDHDLHSRFESRRSRRVKPGR